MDYTTKEIETDSEKEEQKRLVPLVLEEYKKEWRGNTKMIEYCMKKIGRIVKIRDMFFVIEKPNIETHFYFGYGYCGLSTKEEQDNANDVYRYAETNENYFIKENLQKLSIKHPVTADGYIYNHYYSKEEQNNLADIIYLKNWEVEEEQLRIKTRLQKLTDAEYKQVVKAYAIERQNFLKRLKTYLKKYGLSKLHCWTFLSD